MILGLFIGESFAELSVVATGPIHIGSLLEHKRWYLPKHGLKTYLQNWLAKTPHKPERVIISSRFLFKLAGHRLGGSVAQIVTSGFEKWAQLTPPPTRATALRQLTRNSSLSSQDLVFPLQESIFSDGSINKPLNLSELSAIHEKLQALEMKKICLHFHNSEINSCHQQQAKDFLAPLGYEIFEPPLSTDFPGVEPFVRWKTNTLGAAVSGTFEESLKEIIEGLSPYIKEEQVFFFDGQLNLHHGETPHRLSSLFAIESCIHSQISKIKKSKIDSNNPFTILHFGLEHFSFINEGKSLAESPWGTLALGSQSCRDFSIQPSSLLSLSDDGTLNAKGILSYEPGPIHLGRGHKPLVADVLIHEAKWSEVIDLDEKQARGSLDRWILLMQTWQRSAKKTSLSRDAFEHLLRKQISDLLVAEVQNCVEGPIVKYGFLSDQIEVATTPPQGLASSGTVSESQYPKSFLLASEALARGL
jgi:hypothetical protein